MSLDLAYVLKHCFKRPKSDRTKVLAGDFCEFVICYTPRDNWSTIAADKIGSSLASLPLSTGVSLGNLNAHART